MSVNPGDSRGFSLLEAMIALTVIGLAAVAMLSTVGVQLRTASRIQTGLEAHALAEDALAAIQLLAREELNRLPDSLRQGRFPAPFEAYQWRAITHELTDRADVFEVAVTVAWDDGSYGLTTRLYRPKPVLSTR